MSVINKMLRDLDQRQAPTGTPSGPASQHLRGTASLSAPAAALPRLQAAPFLQGRVVKVLLVLALLAVCAGAGLWWWRQPAALPATPATQPAAIPSGPGPVNPPAAAAAPTQLTVARAPEVAALPLPEPAKLAPRAESKAQAVPTKAVPEAVASAGAPIQLRMSAIASLGRALPARATPTPGPLAPSSSAAPSTEPANPAAHQAQPQPQPPPGREALAQAQALWNAGSHDAAMELLQQALTLAERSAGAPGAQAVTASLARELARMQLAEGRAAATLELLTRLEPSLAREADIWALRGNAAQRLGRHPESLRAYTAALQLRPGEQRWLLGAAVSLAAMGQTANATEMLDKARALGPISKEVQAYLRQAGVPATAP